MKFHAFAASTVAEVEAEAGTVSGASGKKFTASRHLYVANAEAGFFDMTKCVNIL